MAKKAIVTFEDADGRKAICTVTFEDGTLELSTSFEPSVNGNESGFYIALLNQFLTKMSE